MVTGPHIAPVGLGPLHNQLNYMHNLPFWSASATPLFVTGPRPAPALACADTPELELPLTHTAAWAVICSCNNCISTVHGGRAGGRAAQDLVAPLEAKAELQLWLSAQSGVRAHLSAAPGILVQYAG